jgi:A/G-specific adenine glycosylase
MLQQTTVKAVIPYFLKFVERWPRVTDLACAVLDDVLAAWAGLGYYSRARNLHACARAVAALPNGKFPEKADALRALPGIGDYTAAAIAAIAFGEAATVVDGNVERVVARLFAVETPFPAAKPEIRRLAATLTPKERPGDFAQAMMDLGAGLCSPRSPNCGTCPLRTHCLANARGIAAALPVRSPKPEKPQRQGAAFLAVRTDGAVLLRRRPPKGLLGGMLEVPGTVWGASMPEPAAALTQVPIPGKWRRLTGLVNHTFTHFHLRLEVYRADGISSRTFAPDGEWYPRAMLADEALPSVMRKVLVHALK